MSRRDDSRENSTPNTKWEVVGQHLYDPTTGPDLATVVIESVAAAEGVDATSITEPILFDVVDITAVKDALFGVSLGAKRNGSGGSFDFEYRGFRITVRGDGWVQVAEPTER
jgi:hypothetical protein